MIQNGELRGLTENQRQIMTKIYRKTQKIRQFMAKVQVSMHQQFDKLLQSQVYHCKHCSYQGYGKQIGAHYRNSKKCKYMKDRPWLSVLPKDWKTDLKIFQEQLQKARLDSVAQK